MPSGPPGDFDLAGDFQALAVEADDGERVVHHALRQQGLAVTAPGYALRPLPISTSATLVSVVPLTLKTTSRP